MVWTSIWLRFLFSQIILATLGILFCLLLHFIYWAFSFPCNGEGKNGWRVELSHNSRGGGGGGGRGRGRSGGSDLKCYECGEPGHFARECRLRGDSGRRRSRSPPRFRRSPSYGRRWDYFPILSFDTVCNCDDTCIFLKTIILWWYLSLMIVQGNYLRIHLLLLQCYGFGFHGLRFKFSLLVIISYYGARTLLENNVFPQLIPSNLATLSDLKVCAFLLVVVRLAVLYVVIIIVPKDTSDMYGKIGT